MQPLVDPSQLKYFKYNGQIEFEDFFSPEQMKPIQEYFTPFSSIQPLAFGFDLWRKNPQFKKDFCSSLAPSLLMQLLEVPKIRYGFSQYIGPHCQNSEITLMPRKSCVYPLIGGLCIALSETEKPETPFCPTKPGHAIFFKMDEDFYLRYPKAEGEYLWLFYTHPKAFFTHQPEDPLHAAFRHLGYEHGDSLKDILNPTYTWKVR